MKIIPNLQRQTDINLYGFDRINAQFLINLVEPM